STSLRVFTILVIVCGYASVAYTIGGFLQLVTEGEINQALKYRRKIMQIKQLHDHVIICGFGRLGQVMARKLKESDQAAVIIDSSIDRITLAEEMGYLALIGNATDETILQAAGIDRARFLATVLPDDAANVFITLTARGLNADLMILARGELPSTENKLRQAGANHVVLPATIGGLRMAHMVTHPAALDFLDQNDGSNTINELLEPYDIQIEELAIPPDSPLINRTIADIEVRGKGGFIVMALRREDGSTFKHPTHNTIVMTGDTLIVMGHKGDIPAFAQHYTLKRQMYRASYRGTSYRA
ncbi:MAG: potassium channel protein, partial [Microcoleus sp. SIO2G3]|nr:potassium channel protein [Microcoleus sp. SIO2G3]